MLWRGACAATKLRIVQPRDALRGEYKLCTLPRRAMKAIIRNRPHSRPDSFVQSGLLHQPRSCHPPLVNLGKAGPLISAPTTDLPRTTP
jgi:hypothetical protein